MISVLAKVPAFRLGRALGRPLVLPSSLTVSVLYACNSRCKSCHIYETKADVLAVDEYSKIFRSLGRAPRWVTISGGEPFLRKDLPEIVAKLHRHCRPSIINLPTNATLPERVESHVDRITQLARGTKIVVNVSLDERGPKHDALRGFDGNWVRALDTIARLKRLKARRSNLTLGIHTVISSRNEHDFPDIADALLAHEPDSYIAEVAERRIELGTASDDDLTPSREGVLRALRHLRSRARRAHTLVEALVAGLRGEYYDVLGEWTRSPREVLPCHAAITSAHVMPEGKVWACCVLGESLGELRKVDYDFKTLWWSAAAAGIRKRIKQERCNCPLANQRYLDVIVDPKRLVRASVRAAASLVV